MARYRIVELAINPSHIVYEVEKHQLLWKWKFEELFSELQEAEAFICRSIKLENESAAKTRRRVLREYSSDCPPPGLRPRKYRVSVTWREGSVQRGNGEGGPTTPKPEITSLGVYRPRPSAWELPCADPPRCP
jgi:hypothetical protein